MIDFNGGLTLAMQCKDRKAAMSWYKEMLGWEPQITVQVMCKEMIEEDYKTAQRYRWLKDNGFEIQIPTEN